MTPTSLDSFKHFSQICGNSFWVLDFFRASSFEFVIAFFFAMIVMYDAMGVRLTTGKEAYILNKLRERDLAENKEPLYDKILDEKMGHTFPEIVAGVITGTICALVVCLVIL